MRGHNFLINEVAIFNGKISVTLVLNSSSRIWRFIWISEQHIIIPFSGFWQLCDTKSLFLGIKGINVSIWRHWPLDFNCHFYSTENETTRRDARIYWLSWHLAKWIYIFADIGSGLKTWTKEEKKTIRNQAHVCDNCLAFMADRGHNLSPSISSVSLLVWELKPVCLVMSCKSSDRRMKLRQSR